MNPRTVLVVDDEREIVDFIEIFFKRFKIHTLKATSGKEAIEIFLKEKPNLVFLDIEMPGLNGLEVLSKIKEIDFNAKVIIVTAKREELYLKEAKKYNITDYLYKPLDLAEFIKKVEGYLKTNDTLS